MPQLRSRRIVEFNTSLKDKENMSIKKSSKIKKSFVNNWKVANIDDEDVKHRQSELIVSFGNLFEKSSDLLDEESVKLIDSSLNVSDFGSETEGNNNDVIYTRKSLRKSINLNNSQDSSDKIKKRNKSQKNDINCFAHSSSKNSNEKKNVNNFRRSSRIKNKVSFMNGHTEIKSPFENEQFNTFNNSTPKNSVDKNSSDINNLTYSNEKVIDLTYSGEKTSTDVLQMLRTPTSKKGTPYVKRLQRKSSNNTSTPLHLLTKSKFQKSLVNTSINSPVINISKTSVKKIKISLPPSSPKADIFIFGTPKPTNRTPFTAKAENNSNIKSTGKSCTKMPNFASAHKKIFEKMESIGEYKQRKAERAEILMNRDKAILRVKPSQDKFNQFGFRLRTHRPKLEEAKTLIMNKLPAETNKLKQQEYIKGVRSNRRFDLLMKSRQNN